MELLLFILFLLFSMFSALMERRKRRKQVEEAQAQQEARRKRREEVEDEVVSAPQPVSVEEKKEEEEASFGWPFSGDPFEDFRPAKEPEQASTEHEGLDAERDLHLSCERKARVSAMARENTLGCLKGNLLISKISQATRDTGKVRARGRATHPKCRRGQARGGQARGVLGA